MNALMLPGTDLSVSCISLGTAALGTVVNRHDSFVLLDAYAEAGGTFLDTAHVYADWHGGERHMSEKTIAHWLKDTGRRNEVVIATKGGHPDLATPLVPRLAPAQLVDDLDESLDCLGIDQIDLYWLHRDDPDRPVGEIMETLHAQVEAGKIRYLGCANWHHARVQAARTYAAEHGLHSFVASQVYWSLAIANPNAFPSDHVCMDDVATAYYANAGMAVLAFTAQARGFFTKAAAHGIDAISPGARADFANDETLARLARAKALAQRLGASVTAVVLAYLTSQPFPTIPIIGPRSLAHLRDSLAAADLRLAPESLRLLARDRP